MQEAHGGIIKLMIKQITLQPRTFSNRKSFPGCAGNPFDQILHSLEKLESMPSLVMNLLLIALALLGTLPTILQTRTLPLMTGALALFFFSDWVLIALLPETKRSFGPIKVTVLLLAILRVPFALLPFGWNLGLQIVGTLLVIYGFYIEPFRLDIHSESFKSKKMKKGASLRILHIGDLHIERFTRREKSILDEIIELQPDLILFSGDVLNLSYLKDVQSQTDALHFFKQLAAPMGVYGVTGSSAVDSAGFFARLNSETPLQWLHNEISSLETPFGKINILGLTCSHNPDHDEIVLANLFKESPELQDGSINLLLYHSPDLAPNASRYSVDLQLSGHTHGGQVRLPFFGALYAGSLYGKTFEAGRYLVNHMPLYVTRGLGMEGAIAPRVRFLCTPEMILWEISSEE